MGGLARGIDNRSLANHDAQRSVWGL